MKSNLHQSSTKKAKKLSLNEISVESFVTTLNKDEKNTIAGADLILIKEETKRLVCIWDTLVCVGPRTGIFTWECC